ncbi:MAG: serine hydrolase [Roseivirga sp.]|nr:serine hydrolase [Roseivirga sp.]
MKKKYYLLWLLTITLSCQVTHKPESVEGLMEYYEENGSKELNSPLSGAFLVAVEDDVLYKGAVNLANRETGEMIDTDTRFYIGSVSKQFAASMVLMLVKEGKVDLHEPIGKYLHDFSKGDRITAHQLLSHTSGLPHYPAVLNHGYTRETFFGTPISVSEYTELIGKLDLRFEPGSSYSYSSFGYDLLGAMIQAVTGNSYGDELKKRIVEPLGLKGTGYAPVHLSSDYAEDYRYDGGDLFVASSYTHLPKRELSTAFSGGGIYSTLNDLDIWSRALINNELLGEEYTKLMFTPVLNGAAYGVNRNVEDLFENDPSSPFYSHFGGIMGYSAAIIWYDDGTRIITLCNTTPIRNRTEFITALHLAAAGNKTTPALSVPDLDDYKAFERKGGIEAFEQYYQEMSDKAGYEILPSRNDLRNLITLLIKNGKSQEALSYFMGYVAEHEPEESDINAVGYEFLQNKQIEESIAVFGKNIELYPNSANCYDSLGEALESKGDLEKASAAYVNALKLEEAANGSNVDTFRDNLARVTKALKDKG